MIPCECCKEYFGFKQFIDHTAQKERSLYSAIALLKHNIKLLERKVKENTDA